MFSFLNPGFLWAPPLAGIPILIHFLSKRRLPEIRFPTVMFLRALEPREIRRLRLREILLLILRTLAILLLVCAFARPSVQPKDAAARAAAAVAVVIDDSESMGAMDEQGRPRIEGARERGLAIVDAARGGDEIAITTTTGPDAPLANRSGDRVRLTRTVRQISATWLPGNVEQALERARRFLGRSSLRAHEVYVISDFQATNFTKGAREKVALLSRAGARVVLLPVVSSRVPNHAIEDLDPALRAGPQGKGLEMRARLVNHADAPSERLSVRARLGDALIGGGDVTLQADESRWASLPIDWRAGAGAAAEIKGKAPVVVESDVDALAGDDRRFAVLGAPRRLRVLRIVESRAGEPASRFTALALDPAQDGSGGYVVETGTPASLLGLGRSRYDVVLLEDIASLSSDAEGRLRSFLREGGGLVIGLGPHADLDYYGHKLFPGVVDLALEGTERASEGQAFEIRARAPAHPILEGLSLAVGSPLTQSRLTAVSKGRITSSRAEAIVTTTGGLPVVVAAQQVSIFLGSFSDDWGDLPYSGAFVPLVRGLVDHAARAASLDLRGGRARGGGRRGESGSDRKRPETGLDGIPAGGIARSAAFDPHGAFAPHASSGHAAGAGALAPLPRPGGGCFGRRAGPGQRPHRSALIRTADSLAEQLLRGAERHPGFEALKARVEDAGAAPGGGSRSGPAAGGAPVPIRGVAGSAGALFLAALARSVKRPFAVIAPDLDRAEAWRDDLEFLLGPDRVVYLPPHDVVPWSSQVATGPVRDYRVTAMLRLGDPDPPIVVIPAVSLYRLAPAPGTIRSRAVSLQRGTEIAPEILAHRMVMAGYRSVGEVGEVGEVSRRGGLLDVFGPGMHYPVRIEFDGDQVASLRTFDVSTQRSVAAIDRTRIAPAREILFPEDLDARLRALDRGGLSGDLEGARVRELVREGVYFEGVDWLAPHLGIGLGSVLQYLPAGTAIWVDEPEAVGRELESAERESERIEPDARERSPHLPGREELFDPP
ncbi:MAG: hypothetical protein AUG74_22255, partial [Bacteroidetes bacterium 13_1_20CM_4_60_6]